MLARNQINATIDHRSFADQGITEQPTIHEGYIAQNMEKKGMIADRCEINRQIRADNKMLRELKAKVAKLAEAVEKSVPIIAETLEAIRSHMIFTQYHLLHNEMQKEVIHDWMNHFNPITLLFQVSGFIIGRTYTFLIFSSIIDISCPLNISDAIEVP